MLRYTLRQLEYALAVQERGSVARAAAAFGVAQPSVSAAIAKLEEQVGLQLFIRHHAQGVTAAPQGVRFLAEARNLVALAQDLQRETDAAGTAIEGTLAIGSFMTLAPAFAPQIIAGFRAQYPNVKFRFEEGTQEHLFDGLRNGRHDLALLYSVDLPADLDAVSLAHFSPHILLPAHHPLCKRRKIALGELAGEPLVLLDVMPSRTYFLRVLAAAGVTPEIAFSSPSLEVVRGLVGQGLGYSILITRPHGDHAYDGEALAIRDIADETEDGVIVLASLRQMRKTRLAIVFEDYCVRHFEKLKGRS
ncbi:MAG: LysR family transcriptional regulator [Rhizobiales bacterium]|nr:LysR family transcriptional regulator [Hyphomicrobiales bacterium]MBI3674062.1 LysR family transcriptional regulator [Hyphomicrobiales bacterium]